MRKISTQGPMLLRAEHPSTPVKSLGIARAKPSTGHAQAETKIVPQPEFSHTFGNRAEHCLAWPTLAVDILLYTNS